MNVNFENLSAKTYCLPVKDDDDVLSNTDIFAEKEFKDLEKAKLQ